MLQPTIILTQQYQIPTAMVVPFQPFFGSVGHQNLARMQSPRLLTPTLPQYDYMGCGLVIDPSECRSAARLPLPERRA